MDLSGPPTASSSAPGPLSRGRGALLWLVLLAQLVIPSSYYLWRADREDERFAWRMFSALRFRSCQVQAFERQGGQEHKLALTSLLHASWIGALRRGRRRVIERFLASRCDRPDLDDATLLRTCREVDRSRLPVQRFSYSCRLRQLTADAKGAEP